MKETRKDRSTNCKCKGRKLHRIELVKKFQLSKLHEPRTREKGKLLREKCKTHDKSIRCNSKNNIERYDLDAF